MYSDAAMTFRWIFRFDAIQRHLRVARITWQRGRVGDGEGYSGKFSIALAPRVFEWSNLAAHDWCFTVFWLRLHYARSYGGVFAA